MLTEKIMQNLIKEKPEFFEEHFKSGLVSTVNGMFSINAKRFFEPEGERFIFQVMGMLKEKENKKPKLTLVK